MVSYALASRAMALVRQLPCTCTGYDDPDHEGHMVINLCEPCRVLNEWKRIVDSRACEFAETA